MIVDIHFVPEHSPKIHLAPLSMLMILSYMTCYNPGGLGQVLRLEVAY